MNHRAPSAAGQYMWVSELGPPGAQRLLSYFVGESVRTRIQKGYAHAL